MLDVERLSYGGSNPLLQQMGSFGGLLSTSWLVWAASLQNSAAAAAVAAASSAPFLYGPYGGAAGAGAASAAFLRASLAASRPQQQIPTDQTGNSI